MLPLNALAGWFGNFECLVDVFGHIWLRFRAGQVLGICWLWPWFHGLCCWSWLSAGLTGYTGFLGHGFVVFASGRWKA